jgi:hypothetical protein
VSSADPGFEHWAGHDLKGRLPGNQLSHADSEVIARSLKDRDPAPTRAGKSSPAGRRQERQPELIAAPVMTRKAAVRGGLLFVCDKTIVRDAMQDRRIRGADGLFPCYPSLPSPNRVYRSQKAGIPD